VPKDNAMLPQTNHCSVYDRVIAFAFDMRYPNPTPTDVIATTRGKCPNSQSEYTPILPFYRRARIGIPSTLSKYSHHKLKGMLRLMPSINIE